MFRNWFPDQITPFSNSFKSNGEPNIRCNSVDFHKSSLCVHVVKWMSSYTYECLWTHSQLHGQVQPICPNGDVFVLIYPWVKKKKKEKKCYDKRFKKKKKNSSLNHLSLSQGFPGSSADKESTSNGFDPWVGKMPWRRKWQPTSVFWPREFHGL